MDLAIKTFSWMTQEFHVVKERWISYRLKSLIFCKLLLSFHNKAIIADSFDNEFIVKSLLVFDNSLYYFILRKCY